MNNHITLNKGIFAAVLAFLSLSAVSCTEQDGANEMVPVSILAESAPQTKTQIGNYSTSTSAVDIWWSAGDEIGVFGTQSTHTSFSTAITEAAASATFNGTLKSGEDPKYVYYPYVASATDATSVPVKIASSQTYVDASSIAANDIKVGQRRTTYGTDGYVYSFKSLTTLLHIKVDLSNVSALSSGDKLQTIKFSSPDGRILTGEFTMNATSAAYALTPVTDGTSSDLVVNVNDMSTASEIEAYANIYNGFKSGDEIDVVLTCADHIISFKAKASCDFQAGYCYDVDLDVSQATVADNDLVIMSSTKQNWDNGATLTIAGTSFKKSTANLSEVEITADQTVDDASLANTIVFVDDNVTLTLGSSATLNNTLIVATNADGGNAKVVLDGKVASSSSAIVALKGLEVSGTVALTGYIDSFLVDDCNVTVSTDGTSMVNSAAASSIGEIDVESTCFHSSSATATKNYSLFSGTISAEMVTLSDNMLLNISGTAFLTISSDTEIEIWANHLYVSDNAALDNDYYLCYVNSHVTDPDVTILSNTWYCENGDGNFYPYNDASSSETSGAYLCESNPLETVDIPEGTYSYVSMIVAAVSCLDDLTLGSIDETNKVITLLHNPSGDASNCEFFVMPDVSGVISGTSSNMIITIGYENKSEIYKLIFPDQVSSSDIYTIGSDSWSVLWTDEFNTTDYDTNIWSRCWKNTSDWTKGQEPDDATLVEVSNGSLILDARKDSDTSKGVNGYVVGGVWSKDAKGFNLGMNGVTGRIDVRAKMEDATGYWPAIWMMPYRSDSYTWPQWGEIDIMEHLNTESKYYATLHTYRTGGDNSCSSNTSFTDRTSWHVFSVIVGSGQIQLLMDGKAVHTCKMSDHGASSSSTTEYLENYWPFASTPYYLILDSQVGGSWAGSPSGDYSDVHMDIDYVRYMVKE